MAVPPHSTEARQLDKADFSLPLSMGHVKYGAAINAPNGAMGGRPEGEST
jgi:hypothetical protein